MEFSDLQIGDKIEIEVMIGGQKFSFPTEITDLLSENRVILKEITHNDRSVGFSDTQKTTFIHVGDKLTKWDQPIIRLVRYKKQICHCAALVGSGTTYNRRESFRMYVGKESPMFYPTANGIQKHTVLVKDISTGGLAFLMSDHSTPIPLNKKVRIHFEDGRFKMDLHAEVIRIVNMEESHKILYGCKFLRQDSMIEHYIMKKQGERLKEMRG